MGEAKGREIVWRDVPAWYEPHEEEAMKEMTAAYRAAPEGSEQRSGLLADIDGMHLLKATFDARLLSDEEAEYFAPSENPAPPPKSEVEEDIVLPGPDSPFQIPARALAEQANARTTDPGTSHAAARSIGRGDLRDSQEAVLKAFELFGPMHHELLIERYVSMVSRDEVQKQSVSGLRTRTKELVDGGLLRASGRTFTLPSKRESIVWEVRE